MADCRLGIIIIKWKEKICFPDSTSIYLMLQTIWNIQNQISSQLESLNLQPFELPFPMDFMNGDGFVQNVRFKYH